MFDVQPDCANCVFGAAHRNAGDFNFELAKVVGPEDAKILLIAVVPSGTAASVGEVFAGPERELVALGLQREGLQWKDIRVATMIGCPTPKPSKTKNPHDRQALTVKASLAQIDTWKKRGAKEGKDRSRWKDPITACFPRLRSLIDKADVTILSGTKPVKAVLGHGTNADKVMSSPTIDSNGNKVLATVDVNAATTFDRKMRERFIADVARAVRYQRDELRWEDPEWEVVYTPEDLERALQKSYDLARIGEGGRKILAYDYEADYDKKAKDKQTWHFDARCLGMGCSKYAFILPFKSIESGAALWDSVQWDRVVKIMRAWYDREDVVWVGHNSGYYDRNHDDRYFGGMPKHSYDTMVLHHQTDPEMRHALNAVATEPWMPIDVPAWKADHKAVTAQTDFELWQYCAFDIRVTSEIFLPLFSRAKEKNQFRLYEFDRAKQDMCYQMHRNGIALNRRAAEGLCAELEAKSEMWKERAYSLLGRTINFNTPVAMRELLIDDWKLTPLDFTDSGLPKVDDAFMRDVLCRPQMRWEDEEGRSHLVDRGEIIKAIRLAKRFAKLATYPKDWLQRGAIIHPHFSSARVATHRLASSGPNFQNVAYAVQYWKTEVDGEKVKVPVIGPRPGKAWIKADYDQVELRFVAVLAGLETYLKIMRGEMPVEIHGFTAAAMMGPQYWEFDGHQGDKLKKPIDGTQAAKARTSAKIIKYLSLYRGNYRLALDAMRKIEDKETFELVFWDMPLNTVKKAQKNWYANAVPELIPYQEGLINFWMKHGYIEDPYDHRRRPCSGGADFDMNKIVNYPVQCGSANLMIRRIVEAMKAIPHPIVRQVHDSVTFEVPEDEAEHWKKVLEEVLTVEWRGVMFTVDAEIVRRIEL